MAGGRQRHGGRASRSVLGPTLWNVMYDSILRLNLQRRVNIVDFADDIALVAVAKHLWQVENHLNAAVTQVREALLRLGLATVDQKTEVLLLINRKKLESINITVGNCYIKSAPRIRYLGVHIDARLRFDWQRYARKRRTWLVLCQESCQGPADPGAAEGICTRMWLTPYCCTGPPSRAAPQRRRLTGAKGSQYTDERACASSVDARIYRTRPPTS
uniref:Reverse transcriptase domain-containing protein n=1 Tax=Trichogramma kaykai TaxID=54128 RepID=A0ABD2WF02_9HYME